MTQTQDQQVTEKTIAEEALELEALLVARAYLYELFHKCFGGTPNQGLLDALTSDVTLSIVDEYADDNPSMAGLIAFLKERGTIERDQLLDHARDEYTRIFVGPVNLPASPYESPYIGAHDTSLFQENTLAVRKLYHSRGYRVCKEQRVPDDHVSIMCHFLALQAGRALETFESGDATEFAANMRSQSAFVETHLANWLGTFAESVRNSKAGAAAVLYPQLLEALAAFVNSDSVFLKEAAYWAEQTDGALFAMSRHFGMARESLERLRSIRLFGLEDNELVICE